MTTATRSVAVVATRLPNIDRRALSQAWFSALHLAQPAAVGVRPRSAAPASAAPGSVPAPRGSAAAKPALAAGGASPRRARPQEASRGNVVVEERRSAAGVMARRIERAIVRHAVLATPSTVTISVAGARVQLLVRTDGSTTRVIALCAPHLRERVDRALAHARFVLAASGVEVAS